MDYFYIAGWIAVYIVLCASIYIASYHVKTIARVVVTLWLGLMCLICLRISVLFLETDFSTSAFWRLWKLIEKKIVEYYFMQTGTDL